MTARALTPTATKTAPSTPTHAVPVFVIDDNRMIRDGLSTMLTARGLTVVATAPGGQEALRQVGRVKPKLVLLDSAIADRAAPQLVQELRQAIPDIKIIVMGVGAVHEDLLEFIKAGVVGFILKDATIEVFVETILAVADGVTVLPSLLTRTLFTHVASLASSRGKGGAKAAVRITRRERQVMESIAEGLSNKEIALRLNVATHTVKSHVHNILEKLALNTRLQVAAYAHANVADLSAAA